MQSDLVSPAPSRNSGPEPSGGQPAPGFVGNSNDMMAVIAATIAAISGLCCLTLGYGFYCLPAVGVILGGLAIANARSSLNPARTRQWGWISVGVSGAILLIVIAAIACFALFYGALIIAAVSSSSSPQR